jgi:hypothetical protein
MILVIYFNKYLHFFMTMHNVTTPLHFLWECQVLLEKYVTDDYSIEVL